MTGVFLILLTTLTGAGAACLWFRTSTSNFGLSCVPVPHVSGFPPEQPGKRATAERPGLQYAAFALTTMYIS